LAQKNQTSNNLKIKTMGTKIYLINIENVNKDIEDKAWSVDGLSDEEFMTEAERQGTVYSLKGFEKDFNDMEINTFTDVIKIIG